MCDGGINFQQKISLSQPINQLLNLFSEETMCVCVCARACACVCVCVCVWEREIEEKQKRTWGCVCLSGTVKKDCVWMLSKG